MNCPNIPFIYLPSAMKGMLGLHGFSATFVNRHHVVAAHHIDHVGRLQGVGAAIHPALASSFVEEVQPLEDMPNAQCPIHWVSPIFSTG